MKILLLFFLMIKVTLAMNNENEVKIYLFNLISKGDYRSFDELNALDSILDLPFIQKDLMYHNVILNMILIQRTEIKDIEYIVKSIITKTLKNIVSYALSNQTFIINKEIIKKSIEINKDIYNFLERNLLDFNFTIKGNEECIVISYAKPEEIRRWAYNFINWLNSNNTEFHYDQKKELYYEALIYWLNLSPEYADLNYLNLLKTNLEKLGFIYQKKHEMIISFIEENINKLNPNKVEII